MAQYRCTVHDAIYEGDRPDHDGSSDDCPGCIRDYREAQKERLAKLEQSEHKYPLGVVESEKGKNPDGTGTT